MRRIPLRLAALGLCAAVWAGEVPALTTQEFVSTPELAAGRLAPWLAQAPADEAQGLLRSLPALPAAAAERVMDSVFAVAGGAKLRRAVLAAMRAWPVPDAYLIERVVAALRDEEAQVREAAIAVLWSWRIERTAPALAERIADPAPAVASEARRVLIVWAGRDVGTADAWSAWAAERVAQSEAICARFAAQIAAADAAHAQLLVSDIVYSGALREDREALLLGLARHPDRRVALMAEDGLRRVAAPGAASADSPVVAGPAAEDEVAIAAAPVPRATAPAVAVAKSSPVPVSPGASSSALWTVILVTAVLVGIALALRFAFSGKPRAVRKLTSVFVATIRRKTR